MEYACHAGTHNDVLWRVSVYQPKHVQWGIIISRSAIVDTRGSQRESTPSYFFSEWKNDLNHSSTQATQLQRTSACFNNRKKRDTENKISRYCVIPLEAWAAEVLYFSHTIARLTQCIPASKQVQQLNSGQYFIWIIFQGISKVMARQMICLPPSARIKSKMQ